MPSTVYYWFRRSRLDHGHAALCISQEAYDNNFMGMLPDGTQVDYGDLYVSWMGGNRWQPLKGRNGVSGDYANDQVSFGGWKVKRVTMNGFDQNARVAMIQEWMRIRDKAGAHWRLFDKNCASVVRRVLQAGGAQTWVNSFNLKHGMASPAGMLQYCREIQRRGPGTATLGTDRDWNG